jgi:hypothetical protein
LLVDVRRKSAGILLGIGELLYDGACGFVDATELGVVVTGLDDGLQSWHIPAIDEIRMEASTIRITIGEDEGVVVAIPLVGELVGIVENLIYWRLDFLLKVTNCQEND